MVSVVFEAIYQSTKANGGLHTLNQEMVSSGAGAHWESTAQQVFCIKQCVKRFVFCLLSLETVGKVVVSVKPRNFWGQGQTYCSFLDMSGVRARWGQARVGKMCQDTDVLGKENRNPAEIESVMQCFYETSKKQGYEAGAGSGWYKMHGCLVVPIRCKQGCAHTSPHLETQGCYRPMHCLPHPPHRTACWGLQINPDTYGRFWDFVQVAIPAQHHHKWHAGDLNGWGDLHCFYRMPTIRNELTSIKTQSYFALNVNVILFANNNLHNIFVEI